MKVILMLLGVHLLVSVAMAYVTHTRSRGEIESSMSEIIENAKKSEREGKIGTDGFEMGRGVKSYTIHGAVLIYFFAGLIGVLIALILHFTRG